MLFFVIINGVLLNFFSLCLDLVLECCQSLLPSSCFVVVVFVFVFVFVCFWGGSNWIKRSVGHTATSG